MTDIEMMSIVTESTVPITLAAPDTTTESQEIFTVDFT